MSDKVREWNAARTETIKAMTDDERKAMTDHYLRKILSQQTELEAAANSGVSPSVGRVAEWSEMLHEIHDYLSRLHA